MLHCSCRVPVISVASRHLASGGSSSGGGAGWGSRHEASSNLDHLGRGTRSSRGPVSRKQAARRAMRSLVHGTSWELLRLWHFCVGFACNSTARLPAAGARGLTERAAAVVPPGVPARLGGPSRAADSRLRRDQAAAGRPHTKAHELTAQAAGEVARPTEMGHASKLADARRWRLPQRRAGLRPPRSGPARPATSRPAPRQTPQNALPPLPWCRPVQQA